MLARGEYWFLDETDINPTSRMVQHLHTDSIGDFGGTRNYPKWTTVSGKGCAGCPRWIWTRSTYMVSHIWQGTSQIRFMLTVDTKRSIGVSLGFPIKKTVIIIFTWAYILFLSSFHAWLSCMVPQALTLTLTPSPRHDFFTNCRIASRAEYSLLLLSHWTSGAQLGLEKTALILRFERYSTLCASKEEIQR
jgi:hypothetical protein